MDSIKSQVILQRIEYQESMNIVSKRKMPIKLREGGYGLITTLYPVVAEN